MVTLYVYYGYFRLRHSVNQIDDLIDSFSQEFFNKNIKCSFS